MAQERRIHFYKKPTFDSSRGLCLGRITSQSLRHIFSCDIFIEKHQGKHADGNWDYRGKKGSYFNSDVASSTELDLFRVIVVKIFWIHVFVADHGVDKYFNFPDIPRLERTRDPTTGVHVQASLAGADTNQRFFEFHCYPDSNATNKEGVMTVKKEEFVRLLAENQPL